MYSNLRHQLRINKIKQTSVAKLLKKTTVTISKKINGHVPFTTDEMLAIKDQWFPYISLDYLMIRNGESEGNGKTT